MEELGDEIRRLRRQVKESKDLVFDENGAFDAAAYRKYRLLRARLIALYFTSMPKRARL